MNKKEKMLKFTLVIREMKTISHQIQWQKLYYPPVERNGHCQVLLMRVQIVELFDKEYQNPLI